jgi:serine/threonine protein kinase/Tfp pilus assembly protein PilF
MLEAEAGKIVGGRYLLEEKLSEGGGGVVWRATDTTNPEAEEFALKILKWSPAKSKETSADRFKREFELFKRVSHPNIAKIFDFGFDEDLNIYYFTSELLLGGDLRKMIGASIPVIENLLLQSLRTLEYLRNFGILHLDIKPQNLLLREGKGESPSLALIDFGLAGFQPPDRPGGTPNYMPPEIVYKRMTLTAPDTVLPDLDAKEFSTPDHRSDLYSLGVSFYYVLCGELPFAVVDDNGKLNTQETMLRHLSGNRPMPPSSFNSEVPHYLDAIIMRLMSRYPKDRYQTALLAQQALCFRSPHGLKPESIETISAYLPEEGMLIGRHEERRILEEALDFAAKGASAAASLICIAGGWGTGKSRLLRYLKPAAQQNEMEVVETPHTDTLQFKHPMAFLIDDPFMSASSIEASSLTDVYALRQLIQTLKLIPRARSAVIFTLNTDLIKLKDAFNILGVDESSCRVIKLNGYSKSDLNEYITYLLGETPSPHIIDELNEVTFGNPRFVSDLFKRMLGRNEFFSYFSGRPGADTLSSLGFSFSHTATPPSLSEYYLEKIKELPQGAQSLAFRLACWQRPVSIDELFLNVPQPSSGDLISLISSGLVRRAEEDGGLFSFANPMAAKIIEASLDPKERACEHDKIAVYLRSAVSDPRFTSFELDRHTAFGSDPVLRRESIKRFAAEALKRLHPAEASEILHSLYETIPENEWEAASEVTVREGQALARMGRFKEAYDVFERLRGIADVIAREVKQSTDVTSLDLILRADELQGFLFMRQRDPARARIIFKKAADRLSQIQKKKESNEKYKNKMTVHELRLKNYIAGLYLLEGKYSEAADIFKETAGAASKLPEEYRSQVANNGLGEAKILLGEEKEAIEIIKLDLESAKRHDQKERIVSQIRLLGDANRRLENYDTALSLYKEALDLARRYYLFEHQLRIQNSYANLLMYMDKWAEAIAQYKPALDLAMRLEGKPTAVDIMSNIGFAYNKLSQYDDAIEYLELALDFAKGPEAESSAHIKNVIPQIHVALGHACYEKKNYDGARGHLEKALEYNRKRPLDNLTLYNLNGTLAEIDLAMGRAAKAKERLPVLEKLANKIPEAVPHLKDLTSKIEEALKIN